MGMMGACLSSRSIGSSALAGTTTGTKVATRAARWHCAAGQATQGAARSLKRAALVSSARSGPTMSQGRHGSTIEFIASRIDPRLPVEAQQTAGEITGASFTRASPPCRARTEGGRPPDRPPVLSCMAPALLIGRRQVHRSGAFRPPPPVADNEMSSAAWVTATSSAGSNARAEKEQMGKGSVCNVSTRACL